MRRSVVSCAVLHDTIFQFIRLRNENFNRIFLDIMTPSPDTPQMTTNTEGWLDGIYTSGKIISSK